MKKLKKVSKKHTSDISEKLNQLISEGYANKSPEVQAEWQKLFGNNEKPDAEEFIKKISEHLK